MQLHFAEGRSFFSDSIGGEFRHINLLVENLAETPGKCGQPLFCVVVQAILDIPSEVLAAQYWIEVRVGANDFRQGLQAGIRGIPEMLNDVAAADEILRPESPDGVNKWELMGCLPCFSQIPERVGMRLQAELQGWVSDEQYIEKTGGDGIVWEWAERGMQPPVLKQNPQQVDACAGG